MDQDKSPREALHCRECHYSRCYEHLLSSSKIHSSIALLAYPDGKDHKQYHQLHKEQTQSYSKRLPDVKECQRNGEAPDSSLVPYIRTYLAIKHDVCRPVVFSLSLPGFYDERIQDCDGEVCRGSVRLMFLSLTLSFEAVEDDAESGAESETLETLTARSPSVLSVLTPCPSTSVSEAEEEDDDAEMEVDIPRESSSRRSGRTTDADEDTISQPPAKKRKNMAYVLIPDKSKATVPDSTTSGKTRDAIKQKNLQSLAPYPVKNRKVKRSSLAEEGRAGNSEPPKNFIPSAEARKEKTSVPGRPKRTSSYRVNLVTTSESESSSDESCKPGSSDINRHLEYE